MKKKEMKYVAPETRAVAVNVQSIVCVSADLAFLQELWDSEEEEEQW